ncbi:radical SAM protein [Actinocorallia sp. API 0066]|uniref:radical SAM/SPASM domain-containing protein n=1 Tax=Actinocorallia sp. API 0066 TaxID=2896846 RepID=UPI001E44E745|nr:radical SAM/SPASM domain-containing protein [Actinocorallia sp. API 0066]MCD0448159.1 radical SAM protein [Actinocorallia sp. API 0066]
MTLSDTRPSTSGKLRMLWLDLTRTCQLACVHCLNDSGPDRAHGTMTRDDWKRALDEAAELGVGMVQFFGGEPTLHPDAAELVTHAVRVGLPTEIYTNLVHVPEQWWELFRLPDVKIATSYYSDDADEHARITRRPTHARTRANIIKAIDLGIPLRVGIVKVLDGQRIEQARAELEALGVARIDVDHVRPYGRGGHGGSYDPSGLCAGCGTGRAAVSPDGTVTPCVFASWMNVGDARADGLAEVVRGEKMAAARAAIRAAVSGGGPPDDDDDDDDDGYDPEPFRECRPGYPPSICPPRN